MVTGGDVGSNVSVDAVPPPSTPAEPPKGKIIGSVWVEGGSAKGYVNNETQDTVPVYLAVYLRPGTQHRYSMSKREVVSMWYRRLSTKLPPCDCEDVLVQIDLNAYEEPPEVYHFPDKMPGMALANMQHIVKACKDCKPDPCKPGEPECTSQRWDEDLCKWVGECGCQKICTPPHVLDPTTCTCECPVQPSTQCNWNPNTCECETCEPKGEKKCPEQVWDYNLCKWVGECPCVEQQCAFGYTWDEAQCKCVPEDLCHVSNKGSDGNWNIKEQQKKFSPGHGNHLDPDVFCPPDYLGICDGRYSITPHPCMVI